MEIPYQRLSPDALRGLIEDFVTRDGTDYGAVERTLSEKMASVRLQIERGEAVIVFDPASGSWNILPRDSLRTQKVR